MKNYRKLLIAKVPGYKALLEDSEDPNLLWHMSGLPGNKHTSKCMWRTYLTQVCKEMTAENNAPRWLTAVSLLHDGYGWGVFRDPVAGSAAYVPLPSRNIRSCIRDGTVSSKILKIGKFLAGLIGSIDESQRALLSSCYELRPLVPSSARRVDPLTTTFRQRVAKMHFTPDTFKYDRAISIEIEGFCALNRDALIEKLPVWASAVDDGSINPPSGKHQHEVKVLFPRGELEPRLFRLCKLLDSMQFGVNSSCGLHVHFDQRGKAFDTVLAKAKIVDRWLYSLRELLPDSRRENRYARFGISQNDRYRAVNVCSFSKHNTLEIRVHSGTCDYQKVIAWIRLCEVLLALNRKPKPGTCIGTLEQLPIAEHDMAYWRARHRALNPRQYDSNASISSEN